MTGASSFDPDVALMLGFQSGDDRCFEHLVDRHRQRVFALVYRFLGRRSDAEDIAQDVFLKVYRARESYRPRARFTTWLYVVCRNTCFNIIRDGKGDVLEGTAPIEEAGVPDHRADSPLATALRQERAQVVRDAVDSLPANQRLAVILQRFERLSYQEIAEVLDVTPKAVKSLLHRAKVALHERLRDYVENPE